MILIIHLITPGFTAATVNAIQVIAHLPSVLVPGSGQVKMKEVESNMQPLDIYTVMRLSAQGHHIMPARV